MKTKKFTSFCLIGSKKALVFISFILILTILMVYLGFIYIRQRPKEVSDLLAAAKKELKTSKGVNDFGQGATVDKPYLVHKEDGSPNFWIISVQKNGKFTGYLIIDYQQTNSFSFAVCPKLSGSFWLKDEITAEKEFFKLHPFAKLRIIKLVQTKSGYFWTIRGNEGNIEVEEIVHTYSCPEE